MKSARIPRAPAENSNSTTTMVKLMGTEESESSRAGLFTSLTSLAMPTVAEY